MYEVAVEAYPDIPVKRSRGARSFEEWRDRHMLGSGDLPEATFIALAGDEVVGYAKFRRPRLGRRWRATT